MAKLIIYSAFAPWRLSLRPIRIHSETDWARAWCSDCAVGATRLWVRNCSGFRIRMLCSPQISSLAWGSTLFVAWSVTKYFPTFMEGDQRFFLFLIVSSHVHEKVLMWVEMWTKVTVIVIHELTVLPQEVYCIYKSGRLVDSVFEMSRQKNGRTT